MENSISIDNDTEQRLAARLKQLRLERGWSLDQLSNASQVSRATLSRLENGEVSPTTVVLGKLCAAYGLAMSRLLRMVEDDFPPLLRRAQQSVWTDPQPGVGFTRRSVSPPSRALAGEALECELGAGVTIAYAASPRPGMEHHLLLQEGKLNVTVDGRSHDLLAGDCLRYQLHGASAFATQHDSGARYFLFLV